MNDSMKNRGSCPIFPMFLWYMFVNDQNFCSSFVTHLWPGFGWSPKKGKKEATTRKMGFNMV